MDNRSKYISMQDLAVGYGGVALIKEICVDIEKGEIVTLIGPNGAGKSTILKSITRNLSLVSGKVIFDDEDLNRVSVRDLSRKMAVVLTERIKTDLLTCYDIVASGRYPYTGKLGVLSEEDERVVDEALAAVHAEELGTKDFNAISDGQRQRILLARAICQEPDVIVLDEPTSFLDIRYKLELLSILRKMAKEKDITVIMSLHEIDLAEKISDKIICVKGDRIYRYGAPSDIFDEDTIRELYNIDNGSFDPLFGSTELPPPEGKEPEVFVISSGGTGIPIYRRLQKENTPFAAGILYPNDIDYRLARTLATDIVEEKPFEHIAEETVNRAKAIIDRCEKVIYATFSTGTMNKEIKELVRYAEKKGKLIIE